MCQPRRAPKSPADTQAEALVAIERIAEAAYHGFIEACPWELPDWSEQDPALCEIYRHMVRTLVIDGMIRPGPAAMPNIERPMEGQLTIDD